MIDDHNFAALAISVDFSPPALPVIHSLEQGIEWRGRAAVLRCNNGPEYIGAEPKGWAERRGIRIEYIQPRKPQQHAYVERFKRTVRYERLAQHEFDTLAEI